MVTPDDDDGQRRPLLIQADSSVLWYDAPTRTARECVDDLGTLDRIAGVLALTVYPVGFFQSDAWRESLSEPLTVAGSEAACWHLLMR